MIRIKQSAQHRSTQIHKENLEDFKKDIDSNTIIVGDFNTPLSKMDRSTQNLQDTAKAVLRGKFIVIQAYLKGIETFQINSLTLHLQELKEKTPKHSKTWRLASML